MTSRRFIPWLAVLLLLAAAGCSKKTTQPIGNQAPVTRLFLSGAIDTISYRVRMHWSGDDPDGSVRYFQIQFQPGDSPFNPAAWDSTSGVDSVFALPIPAGSATYTFWVRAVDNEGLADPHPQHLVLNLRNRPPRVEFINLPHRSQGGNYHFLPVLTLQWSGTDPEGASTLRSFHLWMDGDTFDTTFSASDTTFTLRLEHFGDVSATRRRTVYLSALDEAQAVSDTVSYTWQVDAYVVGRPRVLLVDDYYEGTDTTATAQDLMYRGIVSKLTGGKYTQYDILDQNRFRFQKDAYELLRHFDAIVWYNEGGAIPTNFQNNSGALLQFLDTGGSLYLSALSVVGQDQILDDTFRRHYLGVDSTFCLAPAPPYKADQSNCNFTLQNNQVLRSGNPAAPLDSISVRKGLGKNTDFFTPTDSTVVEFYIPGDQAGYDEVAYPGFSRSRHVGAVTRTLPSGRHVTFCSIPLYRMDKFGNRDDVVTRLVGTLLGGARADFAPLRPAARKSRFGRGRR